MLVYELVEKLKKLDQEQPIALCGGNDWNFYLQEAGYSIDHEDNSEYGLKILENEQEVKLKLKSLKS